MCHGCDISMVFCKAIAYAQSCIHQEELQLRPKQEETLLHLFNGQRCICEDSYGLWEVSMLPATAIYGRLQTEAGQQYSRS